MLCSGASVKMQKENRQSQATQSKTKAVIETARDWKQSLCYPALLYAIMMKMSTIIFIALSVAFVTIAWIFDYPYRFIFLLTAVILATVSMIIEIKRRKP